jgi:hypothetical protein
MLPGFGRHQVIPKNSDVKARGLSAASRASNLHKFSSGQNVYYEPTFGNAASRGKYTIVRPLPVENDNRLAYRIKSIAESFERIAEEHQLTRTD